MNFRLPDSCPVKERNSSIVHSNIQSDGVQETIYYHEMDYDHRFTEFR